MTSPVYIIGHKNPDTDSICSALALTELKQKMGMNAVAGRIGHLNPETSFILKKLGLDAPLYMTTAKNTLSEIEIDEAITIPRHETLRHGWDLCLDKAKALYVVDEKENYIGMATIGDVSKVQMQDLNITKDLLKETPLENIVKCLKGEFILRGNLPMSGEVRISDKKLMERDLKGAIMVLSDHEDDMIKSMAKGCAVIVIAESFVPNDYILEMARKYGVTLISTNYNTMKIIQMIYRSIPIELIMTPASQITSFNQNEFLEDVEREMLKSRHSSYPVLDHGKVIGSVARYHLLKAEKKQFILVDHNEKKQTINDIDSADILEIVDHHRIGDIQTDHPIQFRNMIVGSSCTIVGQMFYEQGIKMSEQTARLIAYGIISDTMHFNSPTCTQIDKDLANRLEKEYDIDINEMATELFASTATIQDKSFDTILHRDSKEYTLSGKRVAISQVFIFDLDVVDQIKEDFVKYMEEENKMRHLDLLLMVFTNVEGKGSRFLYVGELAHTVGALVDSFAEMGYVSRKKQIVPCLAQELA